MDQANSPVENKAPETGKSVARDDAAGDAGGVETGSGSVNGSGRAWAESAAQGIWRHEKATPAERKFMSERGGVMDADRADAIKAQIAMKAQDPEAALIKAVKNNRVVGFSDMHVRQGPYFQFLIDEMPKLKAAGVTDVTVEIPQPWQKDVDNWSSTDQSDMAKRLTDSQSLLDVVDAAKKNGLQVTAVDELYMGPGDNIYSRDRTMAKNIEHILQDPNKKVLYFVGAEHLGAGYRRASMTPTAVQKLRDDNYSVETFYQQIPSLPDGMAKSTRDLKVPINVDTSDADLLGGVQTTGVGKPPYKIFDNVIFYPLHYKMDGVESELKSNGVAPADALKEAVKDNRVVLLGEMRRQDPENVNSAHRALVSELIPEMKKAGLTDLALNIPAKYQDKLDEFAKSGLPDGVDVGMELGLAAGTIGAGIGVGVGVSGQSVDSFRPVLKAAIDSGLKLHAIGQEITPATQMKDVIDGLAGNLRGISDTNNGGKTLLWSDELFVAKFFQDDSEVSVSRSLNEAGVRTTAIADFSQDFDKFSPGIVNQLVSEPVVVKPEQTSRLRTIVNNQVIQMDRFDQVIVYPSE